MQDVSNVAKKSPLPPLSDTASQIQAGDTYEHYSGKRYTILGVGRHSENLIEHVVYQALYGDGDIWIRPLDMFVETVSKENQEIPRFKKIVTLS